MLDLVRHILTSNTALTAVVPASKVTTDFRVQTENTPAIVLDWVSTEEMYSNLSDCAHSKYTYDIVIYTKGLQSNAEIMALVVDAVDQYQGQLTTAAGNDYSVHYTMLLNRVSRMLPELDMAEGVVSILLSAER